MSINRRHFLAGLAAVFATSKAHGSSKEERYLSMFRGVQTAANDIILAIEDRLQTLPPGKTLFVPVGEIHTRPSHVLVQQALLQGLKRRGHRIAFGYEGDYDLLAEEKIPLSDELAKTELLASDPDGENLLKMISNTDGAYEDAFASMQNLFRFCLAEKISTSFNDLAKINGLWRGDPVEAVDGFAHPDPLDPADPRTIFYSRRFNLGTDVSVDADEPIGMAMRNAAMVLNSMEHAKAKQARVYIQHCGAAHIPSDSGLVAGYSKEGQEALPVILSRKDQPVDIAAVTFNDLDRQEYKYNWLDGTDDRLRKLELSHMRLLMKHTDLELYDGADPRFQETAAMKALSDTEQTARIEGGLGGTGMNPGSLDFHAR